jgi:hypothetical protein
MFDRIRSVALAVFASLVLAGYQQGVLAIGRSFDTCPICFAIGFDCEGGNFDCQDINDDVCSDLCRDFGQGECAHNWGVGFVAGCTDNVVFSCACAPEG